MTSVLSLIAIGSFLAFACDTAEAARGRGATTLMRATELRSDRLIFALSGTDSKGCEWRKEKSGHSFVPIFADQLLRLPIWEVGSPRAPRGCAQAHDSVPQNYNWFRFGNGVLIVTPSGLFPPSEDPKTDMRYSRVWFSKSEVTDPGVGGRNFCIEKTALRGVIEKMSKKYPGIRDCEY